MSQHLEKGEGGDVNGLGIVDDVTVLCEKRVSLMSQMSCAPTPDIAGRKDPIHTVLRNRLRWDARTVVSWKAASSISRAGQAVQVGFAVSVRIGRCSSASVRHVDGWVTYADAPKVMMKCAEGGD